MWIFSKSRNENGNFTITISHVKLDSSIVLEKNSKFCKQCAFRCRIVTSATRSSQMKTIFLSDEYEFIYDDISIRLYCKKLDTMHIVRTRNGAIFSLTSLHFYSEKSHRINNSSSLSCLIKIIVMSVYSTVPVKVSHLLNCAADSVKCIFRCN